MKFHKSANYRAKVVYMSMPLAFALSIMIASSHASAQGLGLKGDGKKHNHPVKEADGAGRNDTAASEDCFENLEDKCPDGTHLGPANSENTGTLDGVHTAHCTGKCVENDPIEGAIESIGDAILDLPGDILDWLNPFD